MKLNRRDFTLASLTALGAFVLQPVQAAAPLVNRRIVLASRPTGMPTKDNFRLESVPVPQPGMARCCCTHDSFPLIPICAGV